MSENWTIVATFTLPTEMHVARSKLEAEGIACQVQDELTVQSYHLYSNAIGGVKLKVQEHNVELARQILIEMGKIPDESQVKPNGFLTFMDGFTRKIPFLKNLILEIRIVLFFTIIIAILALFIWWMEV
jgi:hypothetical protein